MCVRHNEMSGTHFLKHFKFKTQSIKLFLYFNTKEDYKLTHTNKCSFVIILNLSEIEYIVNRRTKRMHNNVKFIKPVSN